MTRQIIVTGAESTGKSTLAQALSGMTCGEYLPEYSREYLTRLDRAYEEDDLLLIAKGQWESEQKALTKSPSYLICDTSLLVMKVWGLYKYGRSHPWIVDRVAQMSPALFILPHYNIPYEDDPLRENPHDRDVLYRMYYHELHRLGYPFVVVRGSEDERIDQSMNAIRAL